MTRGLRYAGAHRGAMLAASLGILALGVAPIVASRIQPDIAWLLYVAERVLDGARYGVDVVEVNPPLIAWMSMVPVMLARWSGLSPAVLYHLIVALLLTGSAIWCSTLYRRHPVIGPAGLAPWYSLLTLALLSLPTGFAFGQREHLVLIFILPYLLLTGLRSGGLVPPHGEACVAGMAAGLGLALKPYYLLPLLLTELSVRRVVRTRRPETIAILLTGLLYASLVPLLHPEWLNAARTLAPLYRGYLVPTLGQFIAPGLDSLAALLIVSVTWRPLAPASAADPAWSAPLGAALSGFALSAVIQYKPWPYLYVPIGILAALSLAVRLAESRVPGERHSERLGMWLARGAVILLIWVALRGAIARSGSALESLGSAGRRHRALVTRIRDATQGRPIAVIATNHRFSFPLVLEVGTGWAMRWPSLWPLLSIHAHELAPASAPIRGPVNPLDARETGLLAQLAEDLERTEPGVVMIPSPAPTEDSWGFTRRFDYGSLLRSDPRLAAILDRYELADSIGFFRLYSRRQPRTSVRQ